MIVKNHIANKFPVIFMMGFLALVAILQQAKAQVKPPRPIAVYVNLAQGLSFGAFYQGVSGGNVIIYANGSRSVSGDIIQANMGYSFSSAIFEVEALPGTLISILNGPDVTLAGSNGGLMTLQIGAASTGTSFIATVGAPSTTQVKIGGTLIVGNPLANPPGAYSGSFSVTFIQE